MSPANLRKQMREAPGLPNRALLAMYRKLHGRRPVNLSRHEVVLSIQLMLQRQLTQQLRSRLLLASDAAEAILALAIEGEEKELLLGHWRGQCHIAHVEPEGVWWQGQQYADLGALAKAITRGRGTLDQVFGRCHVAKVR